jgi:AraC family transcriptional regulator
LHTANRHGKPATLTTLRTVITGNEEATITRRRSVPAAHGAAVLTSVELQGLRVVEARFPEGLSLPRHYHDRACLTVVLAGAFSEYLLGRSNECRPATVLAKPPLEPHTDLFASDVGSRQIIVEPDSAWLEHRPSPGRLFREITNLRDSGAELIGHRLAEELPIGDSLAPLAIEGLVLELFALTARRTTPVSNAPAPRWLRRARELVHEDTSGNSTVAAIAAVVGVHPVYLARMFRLHFGTSVATYARRVRLDRAAVLIAGSDVPIAVIAIQTWVLRSESLYPLVQASHGSHALGLPARQAAVNPPRSARNVVPEASGFFKQPDPRSDMLPPMAKAAIARSRRTLPRIERVRRGWVFRDSSGRGWWLDDTVAASGAYRVVPAGHPSAHCRVFTPMVGARDSARRVYHFRVGEDHTVALRTVAAQHATAGDDCS